MSGEPRRGWRPKRDRSVNTEPTDSGDTCPDHAAALAPARVGPGEHVVNVLAGLREPIVVTLVRLASLTSIPGRPLAGWRMGSVGVSLASDAGGRSGGRGRAGDEPAQACPAGPAAGEAAEPAAAPARRPLLILAGLACGVVYVLVVGSFTRYSWPATAGIVSLGTMVVLIGWRGPRRFRPASGPLPIRGTVLWGVVFVAGCLWELSSLLQQPTLTTSSYDHPTISTLTDPALSTMTGRVVVLAAWLGLGWFLVER